MLALRIFFDYYEWIIETIKILKQSNEIWSLRIHPNSYPWGENTYDVIKEIKNKDEKKIIYHLFQDLSDKLMDNV